MDTKIPLQKLWYGEGFNYIYSCGLTLKRYKQILQHLRFDDYSSRDDEHIDYKLMNEIRKKFEESEVVQEYLEKLKQLILGKKGDKKNFNL